MIHQKLRRLRQHKRSKGIVIMLMVATGGVAFALLQSQTKLTGNTISTATPNMAISQTDTSYAPTTAGYNFSGIIPGSQPSQTEHFLLKNVGNAPLAVKIAAGNTIGNPANADLTKVKVILTPYSTVTYMPGTPQTFTLQSLIDANASGGLTVTYPDKLATGMKEEFNVQIAMDADAVNGSNATISNVDLIFNGVATN